VVEKLKLTVERKVDVKERNMNVKLRTRHATIVHVAYVTQPLNM
jgi:hypothetical protein